jgi:hypothetical protein
VLRIDLATPEEKRRLAQELRKLPGATDREWAARSASEAMAGDLNAIGTESFGSEASEPPPEPDSRAESTYAESRQAVISALAGVLKSQTATIHVGNDLLQSVADALLGAVAPAVLDNIVPKNLRDVKSIHQWMAQRLRRAPPLNVIAWNVEPDWDSLCEREVTLPKVRLIPKFAPGEFSEKPPVERPPVEVLP